VLKDIILFLDDDDNVNGELARKGKKTKKTKVNKPKGKMIGWRNIDAPDEAKGDEDEAFDSSSKV
jgi:hypothetical protein